MQNKSKISRIIFLVTKTILVLWMLSGGVSALLGADFMVEQIEKLGYPSYFAVILGIAKLIGALIFILPVKNILKIFAYVGVIFEVTSAFASYVFAGFWQDSIPPVMFLCITVISFFLWFKVRKISIGTKPKMPRTNDFRPELITNKGFVKIYETFQIKNKHLISLKN